MWHPNHYHFNLLSVCASAHILEVFNTDYIIASSYKFLTPYGVGPNVLELSFTDKVSDNYEESLLLK